MKRNITKTLLYEKVIEHLLRYIVDVNMELEDKFPSERELVKEYGVSRSILREAFHILEDRGIVKSYQGKGRFLKRYPPKEIDVNTGVARELTKLEKSSFLEIYEARKIIEVNAMDIIIERATEEDIQELDKLYREFKSRLDIYGVVSDDFDLHLQYIKMGHNYILEETFSHLYNLLAECKSPYFIQMILEHKKENYINEHGNIIEGIKEKDLEKAKNAMLNHIQNSMDLIIFA